MPFRVRPSMGCHFETLLVTFGDKLLLGTIFFVDRGVNH